MQSFSEMEKEAQQNFNKATSDGKSVYCSFNNTCIYKTQCGTLLNWLKVQKFYLYSEQPPC